MSRRPTGRPRGRPRNLLAEGTMRHCTGCDTDMPLVQFHTNARPDGRVYYRSRCKACAAKYSLVRYHARKKEAAT